MNVFKLCYFSPLKPSDLKNVVLLFSVLVLLLYWLKHLEAGERTGWKKIFLFSPGDISSARLHKYFFRNRKEEVLG